MAVDFVRAHHAWAAPVAFAFAFLESICAVFLANPGLGSPGKHRGAGGGKRHSFLADMDRGRCGSGARRLDLLLARVQVQRADQPGLASVALSRSVAARPCLHGTVGRAKYLHRQIFLARCARRFPWSRVSWKCLIGLFRLPISSRPLCGCGRYWPSATLGQAFCNGQPDIDRARGVLTRCQAPSEAHRSHRL